MYAVDLIGEPGMSAPTRPPWDGPAFAEWLADTDGLGLEHAMLLGISQGGWTALKFAVTYPERVDRACSHPVAVADRPSFLLWAVGLSFWASAGIDSLTRYVMGMHLPPEVEAYMALIIASSGRESARYRRSRMRS
ncbi:MAG: hypothetical protein R3C44_11760 [Chloroflexota bacterium]